MQNQVAGNFPMVMIVNLFALIGFFYESLYKIGDSFNIMVKREEKPI